MFVADRCLGTLEAALEELEAGLALPARAFEGWGFTPGTPSSGGSCASLRCHEGSQRIAQGIAVPSHGFDIGWQPEPDGWHETFIGLEP